jgi:hypothetical protein
LPFPLPLVPLDPSTDTPPLTPLPEVPLPLGIVTVVLTLIPPELPLPLLLEPLPLLEPPL